MGLPAFKPSDRGLQKDLNQIKVGEIIAWGAHKGKIIKQFREVAGTRMENGVEFPPPMAIAATRDKRLSYEVGMITGIESRALGVRQNYAPVLDINNNCLNPIINYRSFSDNPNIVSQYGKQFIRGLHKSGIIATAKHFPGHGATETDSHNELPVIKKSKKLTLSSAIVHFLSFSLLQDES